MDTNKLAEVLAKTIAEYLGQEEAEPQAPQKKVLEDCSPKEIAEIAESGKASEYFNIGAEKAITLLSGEKVVIRIADFNHDDLADGSGKAGITFEFKHTLDGYFKMNDTDTNEYGWEESKMRTVFMQRLYNLLPDEWKSVIKTVNKYTSAGCENNDIITTADKLFLASEVEFLGSTEYSFGGEGYQYKLYEDEANRDKKNTYGESEWLWLRSPSYYDTYNFVFAYQGAVSDSRANSAYALAPLFVV